MTFDTHATASSSYSTSFSAEFRGKSGWCEGALGLRNKVAPVGMTDKLGAEIYAGSKATVPLFPSGQGGHPEAWGDGLAFFEPQRGNCTFTMRVFATD